MAQDVIVINAFEVPPEADDPFIAGWERARDFLASRNAYAATTLHRAIRPDVELRFVNVARVDSPQVWGDAIADPEFPGSELPFKAHRSLYEIVRENAMRDVAGGVVLIDPFEVPADADEDFLAGWDLAREALAPQRGYLGTRLHRSLAPADFRFVNLARWSSPLAFSKAVATAEFRQAAAAMPFASHPTLYQVI